MHVRADRPLIVRLRNWVGDVLLTVPALRLLQAHGHALQLYGKRWAASLLAGEVWPLTVREGSLRERVAQLAALRRQASERDAGFARRDNAIVFPTAFSAALEMRLAGLKAVGYAAEARGALLARALPPPNPGDHELLRYWTLACRFLRLDPMPAPPASIALRLAPGDVDHADARLAARAIATPFVVACPFAGGQVDKQDKAWPAFPDFVRRLRGQGLTVVVCPGPGEEAPCAQHYAGVVQLDGVPLGEYGALMRRAAVVVANDSGPAHLAAAVGARLVAVLGPTDPARWAPWGPGVDVVRRWPQWPGVDEVFTRSVAQWTT